MTNAFKIICYVVLLLLTVFIAYIYRINLAYEHVSPQQEIDPDSLYRNYFQKLFLFTEKDFQFLADILEGINCGNLDVTTQIRAKVRRLRFLTRANVKHNVKLIFYIGFCKLNP